MTTIELSDQEAALFLEYRKNQDTFRTLYDAGVFNIKNGTATLSFDHMGELARVDYNISGYIRGKAIVQVVAKAII